MFNSRTCKNRNIVYKTLNSRCDTGARKQSIWFINSKLKTIPFLCDFIIIVRTCVWILQDLYDVVFWENFKTFLNCFRWKRNGKISEKNLSKKTRDISNTKRKIASLYFMIFFLIYRFDSFSKRKKAIFLWNASKSYYVRKTL